MGIKGSIKSGWADLIEPDYTEEEMEALQEAGYDTGSDKFMGDAEMAALGGAASGALTGFQSGGPAGAIGGAALGGLTAGLAYEEDARAKREAILRDLELQKDLDAVDNQEKYLAATGVQTAGQRQEDILNTQQAAARAGLGGAAAGEAARRSGFLSDLARAKEKAAAFGRAKQADIADKRMILQEEMIRQELFDQAMSGGSAMDELGSLAGSLAQVASTQDKDDDEGTEETDAGTKDTTGGTEDGAAARTVSEGETAETVRSYGGRKRETPEEVAAAATKKEVEDLETTVSADQAVYSDTLGESSKRPQLPFPGSAATGEEFGSSPGAMGQIAQQRGHHEPSTEIVKDVTKVYPEMDKASKDIARDLQTGKATRAEYEQIKRENPAALMDTLSWNDALGTIRRDSDRSPKQRQYYTQEGEGLYPSAANSPAGTFADQPWLDEMITGSYWGDPLEL